jgi:hypothetical protein
MAISGYEASIIKGMLLRGDKQQWIVAYFGGDLNPGRIADINTGKTWTEVAAAHADQLPPPGPYAGARSMLKARETLQALRDLIDETLQELNAYEARD